MYGLCGIIMKKKRDITLVEELAVSDIVFFILGVSYVIHFGILICVVRISVVLHVLMALRSLQPISRNSRINPNSS